MKFEEVLPLMRESKKARTKSDMDYGFYWICGKKGNEELGFPMIPTIVKIQNDGTHLHEKCSLGISTCAIMDESWEIFE